MVKTIRIENEETTHRDLLKIQGEIQARTGESTSMEDVLNELIDCYYNRKRGGRKSK